MSSRNASSSRSSRSSRQHDSSKRSAKAASSDESENEVLEDSDVSSDDARKKSKHKEKDKPKVVISADIGQLINRILCTACGKQLNHTNPGAVRKHPWLKVVTCKKCYRFLRSGPFTRDKEGIDEQCRWCGDGGRIYGCDYCHNCFCRSCIKRNLGRSEAAKFESEDDSKWHCYICKPKKIHKLRDDCSQILAYIAREEEKEKERERKAKIREQKKKEKELKEKEEGESKAQRDQSEEREKSKDRDSKEREESSDKSVLKRTLRAPNPKPTPAAPIVVDDSPQKKPAPKPIFELKKDTKLELKNVQKFGNAVKQVVVLPRGPQPVTYPYKPRIQPGFQIRPAVQMVHNLGPLPQNNMTALQNAVNSQNVESSVEKMLSVTQSLTLILNSIKTDLAIAKIAKPNMFAAKNAATFSMRNGMGDFFMKLRSIFKVQISADAGVIEIDGSSDDTAKKGSSNDTPLKSSTPVRAGSKSATSTDPDVSMIPISLDDSDAGEQKVIKEEIKTEQKVNGDEPLVVSDDEVTEDENTDAKNKEDDENKEDDKGQKDEVKDSNGGDVDMEVEEDYVIEENVEDDDDDDEQDSAKEKKAEVVKVQENGEEDGEKESEVNEEKDEDDDIENGKKESGSSLNGAMDTSENTAAELALLKEMADEINEKSAMETEEPRRSSRRQKHEEADEDEDESIQKSSRHSSPKKHKKVEDEDEAEENVSKHHHHRKHHHKSRKSQDDSEEKIEKESNASSEDHSKHKHHKKDKVEDAEDDISPVRRSSRKKQEDGEEVEEEKEEGRRSSRKKSKEEVKEDNDSEKEDEGTKRSSRKKAKEEVKEEDDSEKEESSRRSSRKKAKEEVKEEDDSEKEESSRRSSRKKAKEEVKEEDDSEKEESSRRSSRKKAKEEVKEEDDSEKEESSRRSSRKKVKEEVKEEDDSENEESSRRSSRKKAKEEVKEEDDSEKEEGSRRSSRKKHKEDADEETKDKKDQTSRSGKKKNKEDSKKDEVNEKEGDTSRRSSRKKQKEDSDEESMETETPSKHKSKSNEKSDKKKKSSTSENDDKVDMSRSLKDDSSGSESDDSDSSEGSPDEFGKRKKKRKTRQKETKDETKDEKVKKEKKKTSKGKKAKSSDHDEDAVQSDSSSFDPELEKEIASLSKETKVRRRKNKEGQEAATEKKKEKADKPKSKKETEKEKGKGKKVSESEDGASSGGDDDEMPPDFDEEDEENELRDDDDTDDLSITQLQKLKKAKEAEEEGSDFELMQVDSNESSDPEVSFPKASSAKGSSKKGKGVVLLSDSDDSDFVQTKKGKKGKKKEHDKLLDAKLSESDSDVEKKGKKGKGKKRKKKDSDSEPDIYDEVYSDDGKKKGKGKRKRIRKVSSSEDEASKEQVEEGGEEEGDEDDDDESGSDDGKGGYLKRRKIRKVMANKKLGDETKQARKLEEERRQRIEERQKEYNSYVEVEGAELDEKLPEGTEQELAEDPNSDTISKILGSPRKVPVTTRCILELGKDKKPLIEINKNLVRKLKPHQVEAVRFVFNCLVENVARLKKEEGAGCILAHCMGLGKTLSMVTFTHTMLSHVKLTNMKRALVVCPLNTVLNWVNEFEIWLDDIEYEIDVYEMSRVKQNFERAQMLKEWMEGSAGVMIIGYDMYRNLVNGSHCKNKKQKKIFYEALVDPGPDLVICDEGHILKNDQTALAKAMNKVKTQRRVVLTGTPLQNNLVEYHCMASFVKPALLGTRKEFSNRFANPITNGQCSDSTPQDVKLMKRRAHILHEMLAGCVQRKDYSALTKYLPPKLEYVVSVRLSPVQMQLYDKYLELAGLKQSQDPNGGPSQAALKGAKLFRDYQALMRIWTHPWVLKLDEIKQENKRMYDDSEDSFVDDNSEEDSFISGSSTPSDSESDTKSKKKKGKGKKKKGRGRSSSSGSDTDDKKDDDKNEVVKKWTSRRRGNEEGAGSSWMEDWGYNAESTPKGVSNEWWAEFVKEEDETKLELSGKIILLFEVLRMCEDIGDKVLVFSQSLLSLDIIEDFLAKVDEDFTNRSNPEATAEGTKEGGTGDGDKKEKDGDKKEKDGDKKDTDGTAEEMVNGEKKEGEEEDKGGKYPEYGQTWVKGADYFRMDGSTNSVQRKSSQDMFNDPENYRARLFLISTKAGSLGINLVAANRVIIFDASWNPSHDIQSIFRVYRFGQTKPVYVYRFLAQGTMEEKIYERQVTKQSLSQRVVDEHQIERHFTFSDLSELYNFTPDKLDDPDRKEKSLPMLPKDHMLAELMTNKKEWLVNFHEHDSLLENKAEQELSEEEKKAAWEDYENEKKGIGRPMYGAQYGNASVYQNPNMDLTNLMIHGQANLGQAAVLQIIQDLKSRFPNLPPQLFQQRVEAVMRQVLTQQIMRQSEMQRQQIDQQKANELYRLNQLKQQIQRQQAMISSQQRGMGINSYGGAGMIGMPGVASTSMFMGATGSQTPAGLMGSQTNPMLQNFQNKSGGQGGGAGKS